MLLAATAFFGAKQPAKPAAKATVSKSAKAPESAKKASSKPPRTAPGPSLEDLDNLCRRDLAWGRLNKLRAGCLDLEPASSATATYWRLLLSDDPNELRKGFAPPSLAKREVDARLLLAAGRYHFARGQVRELGDIVEIGRKAKLKGLEIDSLGRLSRGK